MRRIFDAAVDRADPALIVPQHLPPPPRGKCVAIGGGKASAAMAAALDASWPEVTVTGVVVTRYGHAVPGGRIEIIEAAHPVPDEMSLVASRKMLKAVQGLAPDDLVIALISGEGSALMVAPAGAMSPWGQAGRQPGTAFERCDNIGNERGQKTSVAPQGRAGRLGRRPARLLTLVISDVPGDDPAEIASGPTVADPSTVEEVREVVKRYKLVLPASALRVLEQGEETPKSLEPAPDVRVVAAPGLALAAAAEAATSLGLWPLILGDALEGEARNG
ncbi:DUF4147 domain-containing protein [Sinorhizobium americanum]|uniref:DUF4147 domain-containing protein n=1 Tax=Sinorhizobium americanum TaxID=194963 RepID=UPI00267C925A